MLWCGIATMKTTKRIHSVFNPALLIPSLLAWTAGVLFPAAAAPLPDFAGNIITQKLRHAAGERPVLVILWDPHRSGHPAPSKAVVERLLFGARPSVADWYRENSGGKFGIRKAAVLGWYDAEKIASHYWNTKSDSDPNDSDHDGWLNGHVEKWAEAIRQADREFDFAAYDLNHNKVLSADELGILIVIPQKGPFGTNRGVAGREFPKKEPLIVDGVRIGSIAEVYTGLPPNLGVSAHELAHLFLGAPDMYMTEPWQFAPRDYSIMDHTYTTAHFDPFIKLKLGWLNHTVVTNSGSFSLKDMETQREALILYDSARGPKEYFILENRWRGSSYDAGVATAGHGIPTNGLAIWHIIEDPELFKKIELPTGGGGEWGRRGVRLIRANGGQPTSDALALFNKPGEKISGNTHPAHLRWIDNSPSRFSVELLSQPGATLQLKIVVSD